MGLRILALAILMVFLAAPSYCADDAASEAKVADKAAQNAPDANATAPASTEEYSCKYYAVKLPDGWRAIVPPEETLGNVNAIFATDTGNTVVTMVAGPSGGEDAQTIASMFAEQFKAAKQPVLKNGQYTFQFPIQNATASAWVAEYDGVFMMSYIAGNTRQGLNFVKSSIKSSGYPGLLPQ